MRGRTRYERFTGLGVAIVPETTAGASHRDRRSEGSVATTRLEKAHIGEGFTPTVNSNKERTVP